MFRCGRARRDTRGDEGAGADPGIGKTVGDQSLIGGDHGVAAKAGLSGERARRRQRFAGLHQAGGDRLAKRLVQAMRRRRPERDMGTGEVERQFGPGRGGQGIGRIFSHGIGTIADQIGGYNRPSFFRAGQE